MAQTSPPAPVWPAPPQQVAPVELGRPGGFWIRFVAYLIDGLILNPAALGYADLAGRSPHDVALVLIGEKLDAFLPRFITEGMNVQFYFGGTSLLIIVGVAMDTVQQVESQLIMRHYDGFMKKTRIRGRRG